MAVQRTFSIIKPDATARNITGKVNAKIEEAGLRIIAQKRLQLTQEQAGGFYAVHKERPFYNDLVKFMTSGPVVPQTRLKLMQEQSAQSSHRALTLIRFTGQTRRKQPQKKSRSSLVKMKLLGRS